MGHVGSVPSSRSELSCHASVPRLRAFRLELEITSKLKIAADVAKRYLSLARCGARDIPAVPDFLGI